MATADQRFLTASLGSATQSDTLKVRQVFQKGQPLYGLLHVSGTFVGTVALEVSPPDAGAWVAAATALTAPGTSAVLIPADADYRFNVTAYTSGTLNCFFGLPA